jgi:predicted TIM-barrel fold metal-dependent hydrolase
MTSKPHSKIIDAHAHIFPAKISQKATDSIGVFYDIPMEHTGTSAELLESGSRIGVSRYLVCSSATAPGQVASINNFIASECEAHPEFFGFGTLHPDLASPGREVERLAGLGLHGVKFHPDFQAFNIDDPRAMALYGILNEHQLPILFHTGDARHHFSSPDRLLPVLDAYPDLTVIAAHFGGYSEWDEVVKYPKSPNLYFDTSSSLFAIGNGRARELIAHFGATQFFFGVDFPMWDHKEEFERFQALGLDFETENALLHENFERVFPGA